MKRVNSHYYYNEFLKIPFKLLNISHKATHIELKLNLARFLLYFCE